MPIPRQRIVDLVDAATDYRNGILEIIRRANVAHKNGADAETWLLSIARSDPTEFLTRPDLTNRTLAIEQERLHATTTRAIWRQRKAESSETPIEFHPPSQRENTAEEEP